jgi:hypothetical protein
MAVDLGLDVGLGPVASASRRVFLPSPSSFSRLRSSSPVSSAVAVARKSPRRSVAFQLFHVLGPTPRMSQTVSTVSRSSRSRVFTALAKSRTVRGSEMSRFCAMSDISR